MAKGSELRAQKSTEKILKAAMSLFMAQGIRKVSVSDIAKKAGVTPATVYNRFGSKDELVRSSVIEWYRQVMAEYMAVLGPGYSFEEKFTNLMTFKARMTDKTHIEFALAASSDDPVIREYIQSEYHEETTRVVNELFEEGRQQGFISPDLKTETILRYAELIRRGLNAEVEVNPDPEYALNLIREITPLVLYGLLGRKAE